MLSRQAIRRNSCAAAAVGLALAGLNSAAYATVSSYYATDVTLPLPPFPAAPAGSQIDVRPHPIVLAAVEDAAPEGAPGGVPNAANSGTPAPALPAPALNVTPQGPQGPQDPDAPFADLGAILGQAAEVTAPAWLFGAHIGLDEIAIDNVTHSATAHQSDLISQLSAGVTVSGITPRLQALLSYTGIVHRALSSNAQNRISHVGAASSRATIIPDLLFLNLSAAAQELARDGFGAPNTALLTNGETTQIYTLAASPSLQTRVGTIGFLSMRYSYSELWRDGNTGTIATAGGTLAPFSGGTSQEAQAQFQMPGTFDARMLNEVALRASETNSGRIGTLRKAGGDFITEYQLTRSFSAIGSAGYESLSAPAVPLANGQGPAWEVGGRWRPNVDSSFLLLYGRHDLKTDVSGQIVWAVTPLTTFTASYTDSLTSSQQTLLGNNGAAQLDADGPTLGVTFEDDPLIAILGYGGFGGGSGGFGGGFPTQQANNLISNQNGLFRLKMLRGSLLSNILGESVSVTAYRAERISLIGGIPDSTNYGTNLRWVPTITEDITGRAEVGFRTGDPGNVKTYNLSLGAYYSFSPTFHGGLRYDWFRNESNLPGFTVNALTLTLRKFF